MRSIDLSQDSEIEEETVTPPVSEADSSLLAGAGTLPCTGEEPIVEKSPTLAVKLRCEHGREVSENHVEFRSLKEFHVVPEIDRVEDRVDGRGNKKKYYIDEVTVEWIGEPKPTDTDMEGIISKKEGGKTIYKIPIKVPKTPGDKSWKELSLWKHIKKPVKDIKELFLAMKAPFRDKAVFIIPAIKAPGHSIHIHNPDKWEIYITGNFLPEPSHITFGYSLDHKEGYTGSAESTMTTEHVINDGALEWKTDTAGQVLGQKAFTAPTPQAGDPPPPSKINLYDGHIGDMKTPNKWVQIHRNEKQVQVPLLGTLTKIYGLINGLYAAIQFVSNGSPNYWYATGYCLSRSSYLAARPAAG